MKEKHETSKNNSHTITINKTINHKKQINSTSQRVSEVKENTWVGCKFLQQFHTCIASACLSWDRREHISQGVIFPAPGWKVLTYYSACPSSASSLTSLGIDSLVRTWEPPLLSFFPSLNQRCRKQCRFSPSSTVVLTHTHTTFSGRTCEPELDAMGGSWPARSLPDTDNRAKGWGGSEVREWKFRGITQGEVVWIEWLPCDKRCAEALTMAGRWAQHALRSPHNSRKEENIKALSDSDHLQLSCHDAAFKRHNRALAFDFSCHSNGKRCRIFSSFIRPIREESSLYLVWMTQYFVYFNCIFFRSCLAVRNRANLYVLFSQTCENKITDERSNVLIKHTT